MCFQVKSSQTHDSERREIRIAVVGRTGSGLSQFIHDATGQYADGIRITPSLHPFTQQIVPITTYIPAISRENPVVLIDTPGFDYTEGNSERHMFTEVSKWTKQQYGREARLDGVIYMHNIWNEELYNRSPLVGCDALEQICGPNWQRKVVFVNSHWGERVRDDGERRELQLREGYWRFMLSKGSVMTRYEEPGRRLEAVEILKLITNQNN